MKLTLSWLKEYLDTNATLEQICDTLTDIGLEVEAIEDKAKNLDPFTVAQIIEATPHENSTKLQICKVKVADSNELLQIVCGAKNARQGLKVAYAPIKSTIPSNGMVIKAAKVAGTASNGMLCSASELEVGTDGEGIIEIDDKHAIGTKISEIFGLNEAIIEINITPNRGDCLGIQGIARDLAATKIGTLKNKDIETLIGNSDLEINIQNEADSACNFAAFRQIKNVKNCASPKWLKDQLESVGINSISAIVDITNYVMIALNRPMHAYDSSKIDDHLNIRFAKENEKFISLKDLEYTLDEKTLVIADANKAIGIAGVIGGSNSSCDLETTDILLESAFFKASDIAYSGRKLNILSDARFRFERGVDENTCEAGIDLATKLILEICGGDISKTEIIGTKSPKKLIEFDVTRIKKLIGIEIATTEVENTLSILGFNNTPRHCEKQSDAAISDNKDILSVTIPSYRHDVSCTQDLIEEVIRIHGYNNITKTKPLTIKKDPNFKPNILRKVRSNLIAQGLTETISWSFIDSKIVDLFAEKQDKLTIQNPISIELNHMRPTLISGLLDSYKKNQLRNFSNLSLFEIGNTFTESQKLMISGIRAGKNQEPNHYQNERDYDVFDVKKDVFEISKIYGLNPLNLQLKSDEAPKYYHPHRSAALKLGKNIIGYFGEIHPAVSKEFGLKNRINAFEIFADNLPQTQKTSNKKALNISDLPTVERDFAFLVNQNQAVGDIIKTVQNSEKKLIKEVNIFDIFTGNNIQADTKSVALKIKIQPQEKTMTSEEIDQISQKIITEVTKTYNATLRDS